MLLIEIARWSWDVQPHDLCNFNLDCETKMSVTCKGGIISEQHIFEEDTCGFGYCSKSIQVEQLAIMTNI